MIAPWPDLQQVVTLGQPTPELVAGPELSPELAKLANDGMAQIRDAHPDRFPAFVASLPMNNVAAALDEMDRTVGKLGARGIQVLTNVNGRPLDHPDFFPIFERAAQRYDVPVWLHPYRPPTAADYPSESFSEYEIWVVLGWPHESSVAMARLVFAEMFDRLPKLRVITHHCGATVPYLLGRVGPMWDELGERSDNARYRAIRARMAAKSLRPIDYFRRFYADTVLGGSTAALRCGLDFFGPDHVVFATDFPFGPENGMWFLRENMRSVDELKMPTRERDGIYFGNALKLMRMGQ
jgi:aminocarboxymuconate-semialdehyde decarboxylase